MWGHMGSSSMQMCPTGGHCAKWAIQYLHYCICSAKDGVSLSLGVVSVVTWTVAEIPQIITNYRQKSTQGLSMAFLATWILGYLFLSSLSPLSFPSLLCFSAFVKHSKIPRQYCMFLNDNLVKIASNK